ncbi:hypothetical protein D6825_02060, partial [Candidatus Woesearchaeota archaeon]
MKKQYLGAIAGLAMGILGCTGPSGMSALRYEIQKYKTQTSQRLGMLEMAIARVDSNVPVESIAKITSECTTRYLQEKADPRLKKIESTLQDYKNKIEQDLNRATRAEGLVKLGLSDLKEEQRRFEEATADISNIIERLNGQRTELVRQRRAQRAQIRHDQKSYELHQQYQNQIRELGYDLMSIVRSDSSLEEKEKAIQEYRKELKRLEREQKEKQESL